MGTKKSKKHEAKVTPASTCIKALRESGMSCEGIADKLKVGVQSIKRWEAGTHEPQPGNLQRLQELVPTKKK